MAVLRNRQCASMTRRRARTTARPRQRMWEAAPRPRRRRLCCQGASSRSLGCARADALGHLPGPLAWAIARQTDTRRAAGAWTAPWPRGSPSWAQRGSRNLRPRPTRRRLRRLTMSCPLLSGQRTRPGPGSARPPSGPDQVRTRTFPHASHRTLPRPHFNLPSRRLSAVTMAPSPPSMRLAWADARAVATLVCVALLSSAMPASAASAGGYAPKLLPPRRTRFVATTNGHSSSYQPLADLFITQNASYNVASAYCSSPGLITNTTVLPQPPFCFNNWTVPIRNGEWRPARWCRNPSMGCHGHGIGV